MSCPTILKLNELCEQTRGDKNQLDFCGQLKDEEEKFDRCVAMLEGDRARKEEREREREAAQKERDDKEAQDRNDALARVELARDPKLAVPVLSGLICHNLKVRVDVKKEIADELKYAREGGGVIDKVKVHDNQDELQYIDKSNSQITALIKQQFRQKPIPCGTRLTALQANPATHPITPVLADDIVADLITMPWFGSENEQ